MYFILTHLLLFLGFLIPGDGNTLTGYIIDADTKEPIPFAYIHVEELNRAATSDQHGFFSIQNLPLGELHIIAHRLGYKTSTITIENKTKNEGIEIEITLTPTLLSSQSIAVTANAMHSGAHLIHASDKLFGDDLRQQMGATLAQTLSNVTGFSQRTMGSSPARPIIRGIGDERLLLLEDGINSGDVSDQSPDHSVTIESSSTQEIEIARGPAALAYGANAVGGVINVINNKISANIPRKITGNFLLSGETVNTGGFSSLGLSIPLNHVVINSNFTGNTNLDTKTPTGKVKNTYNNSFSTSLGISYIQDWGYLGASFSYFDSDFGIPPDPSGHPDGVVLDMHKYQYVIKAEYVIDNDFFKIWETNFSINNYNHIEYEASDLIGMEFGLVTTTLRSDISHRAFGFLEKGNFGISLEMEDYAVIGAATPSSNSYNVGAFLLEEKDFGKLHVEAGIRFDYVLNAPKKDDPTSSIGTIRSRPFHALSTSVSSSYPITDKMILGATYLHSFRAPSLEELYSEGPHLAVYTYEIGNPNLEAERGLAKELFVAYNNTNTIFKAAVYHNKFSNYLYAQDTGRRNFKNPDLNDFQFVGVDAKIYGFEVSAEQQFLDHFLFKGSVNHSIGRQNESTTSSVQVPLPLIPPLTFKTSIKYSRNNFDIGTRITVHAKQDDLGAFETPTNGFTLLGGFVSYRITSGKLLHTFSLNATNILNTTYRNHLSIIKELNPEAGRNLSFLYRLYF